MSEELIHKVTLFSINKAIDQMPDYGWCPDKEGQGPAEIDELRNIGKCTECRFKFCIQCKAKFHPFKRCPIAVALLDNTKSSIKAAKSIVDQHLSMLYIQNCSKQCPKCSSPI